MGKLGGLSLFRGRLAAGSKLLLLSAAPVMVATLNGSTFEQRGLEIGSAEVPLFGSRLDSDAGWINTVQDWRYYSVQRSALQPGRTLTPLHHYQNEDKLMTDA